MLPYSPIVHVGLSIYLW